MVRADALCLYTSEAHAWGVGRVRRCVHDVLDIVDLDTGAVVQARSTDTIEVRENALTTRSDLLDMPTPHEGLVLHWLRRRYTDGKRATRLGRIMLQMRSDVEPTCSSASEVYTRMLQQGRPQTLAVLGVSLADKHMFVASSLKSLLRCGGAPKQLQEVLAASIGLLQFFGSARTIHGSETPCFSCAWHLGFAPSGVLASLKLSTAALESSRILSVTENERLFTAAYLLLAGKDASKYLATSAVFPQIAEGVAPDAQDKVDYERASALCQEIGLDNRTRDSLWRLVSAALHVGSLELVHSYSPAATTVKVSPDSLSSLKLAAGLLGLDPAALSSVITCSSTPAVTRDTIACAVYTSVFDNLVRLLNGALLRCFTSGSEGCTEVVVIDAAGAQGNNCVFGVEELLRHSLCEVLEGRYRCDAVERVRLEADLETGNLDASVGLAGFDGPTSQEATAALFGPESVLDNLEAADSDLEFYDSVISSRSPLVYSSMTAEQSETSSALPFAVYHTSGTVTYDARGFVHGNAPLPRPVAELLNASPPLGSIPATSSVARLRGFIRMLLDAFAAGETAWVRTISPSVSPRTDGWNGMEVVHQLRGAGVMSVLHFSQQSHDTSMGHREFSKRYACLSASRCADTQDLAQLARDLSGVAARFGCCIPRPLQVTPARVLGCATVFRALDGGMLKSSSAILLAFIRGWQATTRCTRHNPRAQAKSTLVDLSKLGRVELSHRQAVMREEKKYRNFVSDQYTRRTGVLDREHQSREQEIQARSLVRIQEVEVKRRKSIAVQSDIWFSHRKDDLARAKSKWQARSAAPSSVVSAEEVAHFDCLADKVSTKLVAHKRQSKDLAKATDLSISERRARAMEEAARRSMQAQKQVQEEARRKVMDARRYEKEEKTRRARVHTEVQKQKAYCDRVLRGEREHIRREHRREKERRADELRLEEEEWGAFQRDVIKGVEQRLAAERRLAQEQLQMQQDRQKAVLQGEIRRERNAVEATRLQHEKEVQAEQAGVAAEQRRQHEVMRQDRIRQHEEKVRQEKLAKKSRKVDWERRQLATVSLQAALAHPHLYDPEADTSPIRGRRTASGEWAPLSQRMGLSPRQLSPRFYGKTSASPTAAPSPRKSPRKAPVPRQRSPSAGRGVRAPPV